MGILHLTLKKKWFDMIASGEKKEEYREIKPYWIKRLCLPDYEKISKIDLIHCLASKVAFRKDFSVIEFRNGYGKNIPTMQVKLLGIHYGFPARMEWVDNPSDLNWYFCLELGEIISLKHQSI